MDPISVQGADFWPSMSITQMALRQLRQGVSAPHRDQRDGIGDLQIGSADQFSERICAQHGVRGRDLTPLHALSVVLLSETPQVITRHHAVDHSRLSNSRFRRL